MTAADAAIATIEAYNNGDGTTPAALTAADYSAAGITGVSADNLAVVNASVLAAATGGADTAPEVQTLVTTINTALIKIEAYNNGDGSTPAALVVQDYIDAGMTGVSADNLAAVNASVLAAATGGADIPAEIQALVAAADAAIATIEAYNNGDGTTPAALTAANYSAAGITGVSADNLAVVNASVLAATTGGADTAPEVQTLVTTINTALTKIEAYNNGDGSTPAALAVQDYADAGITGVSADNLAAVNASVLAAATGGADIPAEIQALVTAADAAIATIEAYNNGDGTTPAALTAANYSTAGITGVSADNLAAVNASVLAAATGGADTVAEIQALVTAADAAIAISEAYNNGDGTTPAALTAADYSAAGIVGVIAENLVAVNAAVLAVATGGADTVAEVQALVTGVGAIIEGTATADTIIGTAQAETIRGLAGIDTLTGNGGADIFDYNLVTDGNDIITDFVRGSGANADKLDLSDLLTYTVSDTLSDFISVTDATNGGNVTLAIDADGTGGTDLTITLNGIGTGSLTLTDFVTDNLTVL